MTMQPVMRLNEPLSTEKTVPAEPGVTSTVQEYEFPNIPNFLRRRELGWNEIDSINLGGACPY